MSITRPILALLGFAAKLGVERYDTALLSYSRWRGGITPAGQLHRPLGHGTRLSARGGPGIRRAAERSLGPGGESRLARRRPRSDQRLEGLEHHRLAADARQRLAAAEGPGAARSGFRQLPAMVERGGAEGGALAHRGGSGCR